MTTNPFDDDTTEHLVLVNADGQHSLWPVFADVPAGWTITRDSTNRQACLSHIDQHWPDLAPKGPATSDPREKSRQ